MTLLEPTIGHLQTILTESLCFASPAAALVLFDEQSPLAVLLTAAYRQVLPEATFVNVPERVAADVLALINGLKPGDLVVLVQSTSFRLDEFRLRIGIFERGLKTIEHIHLGRMSPEQEPIYVEALRFNKADFQHDGHGLKAVLESAQKIEVFGPDTHLIYDGPMEEPKLNIGDYTGMKNIGGTFPIGEIFTEPKDLTRVNGEITLFGLANMEHYVGQYEPFKVLIENGVIQVRGHEPEEFRKVIELISATERPLVREFGLGLNRAMNRHQFVNDITAYERQRGLHLSLGEKHGVYKKDGFNRKETRYHVDVFAEITRMTADGKAFYENGEFCV